MVVLKKPIKDLIMQCIEQVVNGVAAKWEGASISGWRIKVYRVGTYFRCDIFPPDHGGN